MPLSFCSHPRIPVPCSLFPVPLLLLLLLGCGYRPASTTLPGDVRSVRLQPPSPGKTGEPELSQMMVAELARALARQGVRVTTSGSAGAVLETKFLALQLTHSVLSPARARITARGMRLRVEFRLRDSGDRTLWRSGLVVARRTWPMHGRSSVTSESSRRVALSQLAADAARQCVELMTSGF